MKDLWELGPYIYEDGVVLDFECEHCEQPVRTVTSVRITLTCRAVEKGEKR